ncbi:hypothetical protein B566_EDAN001948 [Ephemera danica]|nr:hypothetical protein B566_EDAN001948 [Ephemera danica]
MLVWGAVLLVLLTSRGSAALQGARPQGQQDLLEPPEGYYAFEEAPNAEPPRVRRPPYLQSDMPCAGLGNVQPHMSINNLCGDLNKGYIPKNPITNSKDSAYPFDLIKNKTLDFFSKTLPILKADDTLPKVAKFQQPQAYYYKKSSGTVPQGPYLQRDRRAADEHEESDDSSRQGRKFCDNGGGMLCMLYKAFRGEPLASGMGAAERRDEQGADHHHSHPPGGNQLQDAPPATPCPAKVEYATPVFAKNYQGVWRYVVQIPYEGYFTQTVEVTRCLNTKCHYLDGSCMSSPRWVSMLVAELFYPDSYFPNKGQQWPARRPVNNEKPPPVHDFQNYQQYLQKRAGVNQAEPTSRILAATESSPAVTVVTPESSTQSSAAPAYCDGVDDLGCFQVRLYYDWFLIPGSCKCWRPDYFNRYTRRRVSQQQ